MRKSVFAYANTKNCTADQCLCFRYIGSTIILLPKSQASSHPVRNPENRFSHDVAQISINIDLISILRQNQV